ncbi:alkaline shock response membrane anchor protein AmaP [Dendrosporobacter sp. 1207_IL3150]|uniref:alkaline shock response membrane anchor protein AmaP n=1 Tax=Dendrosporobacter sp. 1207_IL3150 TaxID=3084054 RepID=UPI002FDA0F9A
MGIIDRIILSIYTLLLIVLALGVIMLSLRLVSLEIIWTSLSYIYGQWEAGLAGLVFLLISLRLFFAGIRPKNRRDTIVHHTEMGNVHISVSAVENLVEKVTRIIRGVRDAKISVVHDEQTGLKISIRASVSPESNVPAVTSEIQQRVKEYIKNTVGIDAVEISIIVENISNDFKPKQRVK